MDLVVASRILQYTPVPRKYIRVSSIWRQCILDIEDDILHRIYVYNSAGNRILYNVLAIRNQWSIIYRFVTQENRNDMLHLCLTFKQFHMFWYIYKKWNYDSHDHRLQLYITWSLMQGKRIKAANRLLNNVSNAMLGLYSQYITDTCARYLLFKNHKILTLCFTRKKPCGTKDYITRQEIMKELDNPFLRGYMTYFANSVSYTLFNKERHSSDNMLYYHHTKTEPPYRSECLKIRDALGIIPEKYIKNAVLIPSSFGDVQ